jgi:hypothetical protein
LAGLDITKQIQLGVIKPVDEDELLRAMRSGALRRKTR